MQLIVRLMILICLLLLNVITLVAQDTFTPYQIAFYRYDEGLYLMNADGTDRIRFSARKPCGHFAFDPTGTQIALADRGEKSIIVIDLTTYEEHVVTRSVPSEGLRPETPLLCGVYWSPDSTTILYGEGGSRKIYTVPVIGGEPTLILDEPFAKPAIHSIPFGWSSDSTRFVFISNRAGDDAIYTANADGSDITYLTAGVSPSFAPDGENILFAQKDDANENLLLYTIPVDGSSSSAPLDGKIDRDASSLSLSPDGSYLLFTGNAPYGGDVILRPLDDSDDIILTGDLDINNLNPTWRPVAGTLEFAVVDRDTLPRIVFERYEGVDAGVNGLYTIDRLGLAEEQFSDISPCGMSFNADGSRLAVSDFTERNLTIIDMMTGESTVLLRADQLHGLQCFVSWNPDGESLLYDDGSEAGFQDIYQVMVDGSSAPTVVLNSPDDESAPKWHPDGKRFVFHSNAAENGYRIWVGDVTTGEIKQITSLSGLPSIFDFSPAWHPETSQIVFHHFDGKQYDLYRVNEDGSDRVNLTNTPLLDEKSPGYSSDGQYLVYYVCDIGDDSSSDSSCEINVSHSDGSSPRPITGNSVRDWLPLWQP